MTSQSIDVVTKSDFSDLHSNCLLKKQLHLNVPLSASEYISMDSGK